MIYLYLANRAWFTHISNRLCNFAIREDFIFTKLRTCEVSRKKALVKISEFTVTFVGEILVRDIITMYMNHIEGSCEHAQTRKHVGVFDACINKELM